MWTERVLICREIKHVYINFDFFCDIMCWKCFHPDRWQKPKWSVQRGVCVRLLMVCVHWTVSFSCCTRSRATAPPGERAQLVGFAPRASALLWVNWALSHFQAEAIHPDCAIISEHLRAREVCSQTRRSEAQNQTERSGGFKCDAAAHRHTLCLWSFYYYYYY